MSWRSGTFDRSRLPGHFRPFAPAHAAENLHSISLEELWNAGKRLILLDVDHTLVMWKTEEFTPEVLEWIDRAKDMGFQLCIISNTKRPERLLRLAGKLGIETVRGRMKPSTKMFRMALIKFRMPHDQAVMIGDQMMTDILGANRAGIDAIWVRKMEGKEFAGTRINRMVESWLTGAVYSALIAPMDEVELPAVEESKLPLMKRTVVRQLIKFLIVGGSSFVIDYSIRMTLLFGIRWHGEQLGIVIGRHLQSLAPALFSYAETSRDAAFPLCATIAATFAILNSFVWNRAWTFQIKGKAERSGQLKRFLLISFTGLGLNVLIGSLLNHVIPGDEKMSARVATILAALIVAVWNFAGQRYFAFRVKK